MSVDSERAVRDAFARLASDGRQSRMTSAQIAGRASITVQLAEMTLRQLRAHGVVREHRQVRSPRHTWELARPKTSPQAQAQRGGAP